MSKARKNLFRQYSDEDPPDPLAKEVQTSATEQGWRSPWALKEEREKERLKKKKAGEKSGLVRKRPAEQRLKMLEQAYDQLDPKYKTRPYSKESIDALYEQLLVVAAPKRDQPRPPPTEDELRSFALDIESILQLPEECRMHVLKDEVFAFEHNLPSPGKLIEVNGKPVGDDAPKALVEDKKISLDEENDYKDQLPDIDRLIAAMAPKGNRLSKVSRATLIKCLRQLGVKGKRQPRRG
jgi:hypothetical protein